VDWCVSGDFDDVACKWSILRDSDRLKKWIPRLRPGWVPLLLTTTALKAVKLPIEYVFYDSAISAMTPYTK
jgi:hypothetical protein